MNRLHITYGLVIGMGLLIALGLWLRSAVFNGPDETPTTIAYSDTIAISELLASGVVSSEAGQAIFTGKGACFTCHGIGGKGDDARKWQVEQPPHQGRNRERDFYDPNH